MSGQMKYIIMYKTTKIVKTLVMCDALRGALLFSQFP